jgi:hypothetical protein
MLVLQISRIPVLFSLIKIIQSYLSMNHQIYLVFYTDIVQYVNINHTVSTNTDPHYIKDLHSKKIKKNCHFTLHLDHMRSYRIQQDYLHN